MTRQAQAGDAVCELAESTGSDGWPELLPFLFQAVQAAPDKLRESALLIFARLAGEVAPTLAAHLATLRTGALPHPSVPLLSSPHEPRPPRQCSSIAWRRPVRCRCGWRRCTRQLGWPPCWTRRLRAGSCRSWSSPCLACWASCSMRAMRNPRRRRWSCSWSWQTTTRASCAATSLRSRAR